MALQEAGARNIGSPVGDDELGLETNKRVMHLAWWDNVGPCDKRHNGCLAGGQCGWKQALNYFRVPLKSTHC